MALLALASLVAGLWAWDISQRAPSPSLASFLRLWSWAAMPYAASAALLWRGRDTRAPRALLSLAAVCVLLVGAWGVARHFGTPGDARSSSVGWMLYVPLMQYAAALPAVATATVIWLAGLREHRRRMWQHYTTRGGAWDPVERPVDGGPEGRA